MAIFTKESLENLRQRIDLVEVISSFIEVKKIGSHIKALCPFHDEKTPSFMIQRHDQHYHCFGCGAHGDAIEFLMKHQKFSFSEAVKYLAEKFHLFLEEEEKKEEKGPSKEALKKALEKAKEFYHTYLLFTKEGQKARRYLSLRGISFSFIEKFQIGLAPKQKGPFIQMMKETGITEEELVKAGLAFYRRGNEIIEFFSDRILFPIEDAKGAVIGFSGRKYKEETLGGKYVNSPETSLFKKSKVLFGLSYCRKRIVKEKKVILVEGQIDSLRLIEEGVNITLASQGTAFGQDHADQIAALGVEAVYLAMDNDLAGKEAAKKIGDFFQKKGIPTFVTSMNECKDPDLFVKEKGVEEFLKQVEKSQDFVDFLLMNALEGLTPDSPASKALIIDELVKQVRSWERPILVQESLKKIAKRTHLSEEALGIGYDPIAKTYIRKFGFLEKKEMVDPNQSIEEDFLRWLLFLGKQNPKLFSLAEKNVTLEHLQTPMGKKIYSFFLQKNKEKASFDLLEISIAIEDEGGAEKLSQLMEKKMNLEKAEPLFLETVQMILTRDWMEKREEIRKRIQTGQESEENVLQLAKHFDELKKQPPKVSV